MPSHKVTVGAYHVAPTEVTVGQWNAVMNGKKNAWESDKAPKIGVSWFDANGERNAISKTTVTESANSSYKPPNGSWTYGGASLDDYIFFLSAREARAYFSSNSDRVADGQLDRLLGVRIAVGAYM